VTGLSLGACRTGGVPLRSEAVGRSSCPQQVQNHSEHASPSAIALEHIGVLAGEMGGLAALETASAVQCQLSTIAASELLASRQRLR
jgi:hypothetical protein